MRRYAIAFVVLLLVRTSLFGSDANPLRLNRERAVEVALTQNQSLAAARTLIEQARARREVSGRLPNPELSLDYSTDWTFNNEGESSFGIGFAQAFPVTKRLALLKGIAEVEIALAEAEVRNQTRLLVRDVESLCNELAHIEAQLGLRQSLLEIDERFAAFVDSRIEKAEASPVDANQVRIEMFAIEQEIGQLENDRSNHFGELRTLLGMEVGTPLEIEFVSKIPYTTPQLPVFGAEMLDTHPEYQLRAMLLEVADKRSSLVLASRWEDIALGIFYTDERSVDEPIGIGNDRFLGVSVSIPLPVRNRDRTFLKESLFYKRQVEQELAAESLALRSKADSLQQNVIRLYRQAVHYDTNVTQLVEQNLVEMNEAYSAGQISLNELFRSQGQRLKIQSTHLTLIRDYEQAMVEWRAATARNLINL